MIFSAAKSKRRSVRGSCRFYEPYNIIRRASNDIAQFFECEQRDVFVLLQRIKRLIINTRLKQLILCHFTLFHRFPQGAIVNNHNHPTKLCCKNYMGTFSKRVL